MLDHVSIGITDFDRSLAFYDAVLATLGYACAMKFESAAGYGREGMPEFWIGAQPDAGASPGLHVAFTADSRAAVDAFHAAALAAGGKDDGAPGLRNYHPNYYAAFVVDPDGRKIEAVCHRPQ